MNLKTIPFVRNCHERIAQADHGRKAGTEKSCRHATHRHISEHGGRKSHKGYAHLLWGAGKARAELSPEEIAEIIRAFTEAALRAKSAGYDGVEIHSAHGYLPNQFYSPLTNRRADDYGGSLENRMRFLTETVRAVRSSVGTRFPISVRLGGCDYMEGGSTIADSVQAAIMLQQAGADLLSVTGGMCRYTREDHSEPGYFRDMSSEIKRSVTIPVLLTGGVQTVDEAEALLMEQAADLIGIGRAILKNPNWPVEEPEKG